MISIMFPLVALFSGAKNLGWDTQKGYLKMIFKTLGRFRLAKDKFLKEELSKWWS
jgi:hypothetical protein